MPVEITESVLEYIFHFPTITNAAPMLFVSAAGLFCRQDGTLEVCPISRSALLCCKKQVKEKEVKKGNPFCFKHINCLLALQFWK